MHKTLVSILFFGLTMLSNSVQGEPSIIDLQKVARTREAARNLNAAQILAATKTWKEDSPLWPVSTFLIGEIHLLRENPLKASEAFRTLALWGSGKPYAEDWGGSTLAVHALYRWLHILLSENKPDPNEVGQLIAVGERLVEKRFARRIFKEDVLSSLPQLQEEIFRGLALIAFKTGKLDLAQRFYLEFISVNRNHIFTSDERRLTEHFLARGMVSEDRLSLFRAKRLYSLGRFTEARLLFEKAEKSPDTQIATQAKFYLARIQWERRNISRAKIGELLQTVLDNTTDPDVAQAALLYRARIFSREGAGQDTSRALADFSRVIADYPNGYYADNALYELAQYYMKVGKPGKALESFQQLRAWKGINDFKNLSYFQPAIALIGTGTAEDLKAALLLLQQLDRQEPNGPLRHAVYFWIGRIFEKTEQTEKAKQYFDRLVREIPYEHYGIRSRMHLRKGAAASGAVLPDTDTQKELQGAYYRQKPLDRIGQKSPYHLRLRQVVENGLYSATLKSNQQLSQLFPSRRLEDLSLKELEDSGLLPDVSLLLSFRQDAWAAQDQDSSPRNLLEVAAYVGNRTKDWPLVMSIVISRSQPHRRLEAQKNDSYLSTAYPLLFQSALQQSATMHGCTPELLYAVMRRESFFDTTALSGVGALGLFQFLPETFNKLDSRWNLLQSKFPDRETFLLNPEQSIDLGARWFGKELLPREKQNVFLAVMEHHIGYPAVREAVIRWKKIGKQNDIEYMMETPGVLATRLFAMEVLTDMILVKSAGLYQQ